MTTMQQPRKTVGQLAAADKPPMSFWRAKGRIDSILDLDSTTQVKAAQAQKVQAENQKLISHYDEKAKKLDAEGKSEEAKKFADNRDFLVDLFEYVDSLFRAFDRQKKAFNKEKDNLQLELEERLKTTPFVKVLQRSIPWLGGAIAGGLVVGAGIWGWFTGHMQEVFHKFPAENVQEVVNILGLVVLAGVSKAMDYVSVKRNSRLTRKYEAKKTVVDKKEEGLRKDVLKLAEIEYDRLAKVYGFQPFKLIEDQEHARAHAIVKEVSEKYGLELPLPDSLLNGNGFHAPGSRARQFLKALGQAFRLLRKPVARPEGENLGMPPQ